MENKKEIIDSISLKEYIFKDPACKWFVRIGIVSILLQLAVFKYYYPYPSFIHDDSFVYLITAQWNMDINTYPIGYSMFLRLVSVFSKSDTVLVGLQYLLLQSSVWTLVFSIFYFYQPGKAVRILLFGSVLFNPVFLYLCNCISSDALFVVLSIIWLTVLLWIICRPSTQLIILHAVVLLLAFTVRYNALYYPIIAGVAFLLTKQRMLIKIAGWALGIVFIGMFVVYTSSKYYELTGYRQFSPFSGWQMANNAVYAYRYVDKGNIMPVPERYRELDKTVRTYFDTTHDILMHPREMLRVNAIFMWDSISPLRQYMYAFSPEDTLQDKPLTGDLKRWASLGPLYGGYGRYLMLHYPRAFAHHYLWANTLKYCAPPVEFLTEYNMGRDTVHKIAQLWFGYKSNKVKNRSGTHNIHSLDSYPLIAGFSQILFLVGILGFISLRDYRQYPLFSRGLIIIIVLWLVNFGFSVFASPVALRFQMFPITVFQLFALPLIEHVIKAFFCTTSVLKEPKAGVLLPAHSAPGSETN